MRFSRAIVIANPATRTASAAVREACETLRRAHVAAAIVTTAKPRDATLIAAQAARDGQYGALFSLGGDGTALEVFTGVAQSGSSIPVAVLPAGTANILVRTWSIPLGAERACAAALGGEPPAIDLGALSNGRHFALGVGVGLEAAMIRGASPRLKRTLGWGAYVLPAAVAGLKLRSFHARIAVDGVEREVVTSSVLVANHGEMCRGLVRFGGAGSPADGAVEVCVYSPRTHHDAARHGVR